MADRRTDDTYHRVMVDLDALLDTRLATVARLDENIAAELFNDENYYSRVEDDFGKLTGGRIDQQAYRELYAARDIETLKLARPTMAMDMLMALVHRLLITAEEGPLVSGFLIEVNTHPYHFGAEGNAMVENMIAAYVGTKISIKAVCRPLSYYSPAMLKTDYSALIIYNLPGWMEVNGDRLEFDKIPRVTLITPAIYHNGTPPEDEKFVINGAELSLFSWTTYTMITAIELSYMDAEVFSVIHPTRTPRVSLEGMKPEDKEK